jgi:hypothetical protein
MKPFRNRFIGCYAALLVVFCGAGALTYALARGWNEPARGAPRAAAVKAAPTAPSAKAFAPLFLGVTNAYAKAHGDPVRFSQADCAQASPGRYMCSYATTRRGGDKQCHIMQARWTPGGPSSFKVTLAGRAARCGSLRQALRSLR